jgi:hypothetical protein
VTMLCPSGDIARYSTLCNVMQGGRLEL